MHPDEEFRSRLRDDLRHRSAPPVGTLAADALSAGRRIRRRRQTLRVVGGTAAVAAVAVGSATLSGAFGSDAPSAAAVAPGPHKPKPVASSPGHGTAPKHLPPSVPGGRLPSSASSTGGAPVTVPASWTVPPAAAVTDPAWVTPRAIIAELEKLLPAGTATSARSGDYAGGGGDPRELWAVDTQMTVTTAKGPTQIDVTLHQLEGNWSDACRGATSCGFATRPDGTLIILQRDWNPLGGATQGEYVCVVRKDGMSVQITVRDEAKWTDDQLFALASNGAWGSLKMDKTFVEHAEATVQGTFANPPSGG